MIFLVRGADARSGAEVQKRIDAATATDAETAANRAGIFVSECVPEPDTAKASKSSISGGDSKTKLSPRSYLQSPRQRRVMILTGVVVLFVAALIWWVNVKERLVPGEVPYYAASPEKKNVAEPSNEKSGVSATARAIPSGDSRSVVPASSRTAFLTRYASGIWNRQNRAEWLRTQPTLRLVSQDQAAGFMEYGSGDNLVKKHAVFVDDQLCLWEFMIFRGRQQAEMEVSRFENALGNADSDSTENLPEQEKQGTVLFREWRISEAGRRFVVRCSVRTGETTDGQTVFYLQQTFGDLDLMNAAGR